MVDSLRDFVKTFEKASKCLQIPLTRPKIQMYLKNQNEISLLINITVLFNIQIDKLVYRSNLEKKSCVFSIKTFELHGNQFLFEEKVNYNNREIHHFYKNRSYVANKYEIFQRNNDV